MYERHILGKEGENIACKYLCNEGYKLIMRNFRCRQGEIDIIAKDKNELVFIEVKTRTNLSFGTPAVAVHRQKQKHIFKATKYFIYKNKLENSCIRFDVIEIYKKEKYIINHLKNIEVQKY